MKHRDKVRIDTRYIPALNTNIERTIAAAKKRLKAEAEARAAQQAANDAEAAAKVAPIGAARKARG